MSVLSDEAQRVKDVLLARGLETPFKETDLSSDEKMAKIQDHFKGVLEVLGMDLSDDSLRETPRRIAKMFVQEIFSGLDYTTFPKITVIDNKMQTDEMISVGAIDFTSTCEHHLVTIDGKATIAYIPHDKVIGLSKINRIVRFFARRPQIQERMTQQVLCLTNLLETKNVAVHINAMHFCVRARGVQDATSRTGTTALGGAFKSWYTSRVFSDCAKFIVFLFILNPYIFCAGFDMHYRKIFFVLFVLFL